MTSKRRMNRAKKATGNMTLDQLKAEVARFFRGGK